MSKTDKTKPYKVKLAEHYHTDQHHHETHDCNLPPSAYEQIKLDYSAFDCHWATSKFYWGGDFYSCCGGCVCEMCSGRYWRRRDRKRDRLQARATIRREDWDSLTTRSRINWSW